MSILLKKTVTDKQTTVKYLKSLAHVMMNIERRIRFASRNIRLEDSVGQELFMSIIMSYFREES